MSKFKQNVGWIFFGNIAHAVFQYLINIICARAFGTDDYGLISYAGALIAFFTSAGTLGFYAVITKLFADDEERAGEYLGTAIAARLVFSIAAVMALQVIVALAYSDEPMLKTVVFCQSLQIVFSTADLIIYWFRYKDNAKSVAILRLVAFFVAAALRLLAIIVLKNISLYVLGTALETGFFSVLLMYFLRQKYTEVHLTFSKASLILMLRISYPFICSSLLSAIYTETDKVMLKSMLDNTVVALYSVSQTLAGAIAIIPSALIEGFRPDIMRYKISDELMYKKRFQQLYGLVFWVSIAYCVFITIFAKPIINILYGEQYIGAVSSLSVIVWYTSFSYFGAINNVYMAAENKTRWVQIITLSGALLNVFLNYILIPPFGIVGAAAASLATQFVANFVLIYFIRPLREDFFIMIEGITLKGFFNKGLKRITNND